MIRKAKAVWRGTGRAGSGHLSTDSEKARAFASLARLDEATFTRMAQEAQKNCPVSKVLNAEIALDAKVV